MTTVPHRFDPRFPTALLALLGAAACSSGTGPADDDIRDPAALNILRLPPDHPPFFNDSVAFYAKAGQSVEAKIHFQNSQGDRGETFADLKLDSETLLARPDGTPFAPGDSVLIVMKVADQRLLLVELRPSGLRFRSDKPAELKLKYDEADDDFDGDGDRDEDDDAVELRLSVWRQERAGDPWERIGTVKTEGLRELTAKLTSFSRYAIAY